MSIRKAAVVMCSLAFLSLSSCTEKIVDPKPVTEPIYSIYDQLVVNGNTAYVTQQYYRISGFSWLFDSVANLMPVNVTDSSIGAAIKLKYPNAGFVVMRNGDLYACTMGSLYAKDSGGIEKVNLATGQSTVMITEKEIDTMSTGIVKIEFKNDSMVYCLYGKSDYSTGIALVNIARRSVVKRLSGITDASGGMAIDTLNKKLYVGERGYSASGLLVFSTLNDSLSAGPISTGLPPYSMAFHPQKNKLFITTSDYVTGKAKVFDCALQALTVDEKAFYQDCIVKISAGKIFILERGTVSNVSEVSENLTVNIQKHLADNSNPVDIANTSGGRFIISLNNLSKVTFINL
ncbi:MAG: hypothetical protein JNL74_00630 [Fibrobacteres bacterium]|nr:hypothetical protein [Fibrobacterota bacterium]